VTRYVLSRFRGSDAEARRAEPLTCPFLDALPGGRTAGAHLAAAPRISCVPAAARASIFPPSIPRRARRDSAARTGG